MVCVCVLLNSFSLLCVAVVCSRHDELLRSLTPKIVEQRQQQHIDLRKSLRMEGFFSLYIFVTGKQKWVVINKLFECIQNVSCDLDSEESEGVEHLSLVHFYCCLFIFDSFFPRWHFIPRLPLHTGCFSFLSHHGCTAPVWGRGAQFPTWPIGGSRTLTFVAGPCARPAVFVFFACATAHTRAHTHTVKACAC